MDGLSLACLVPLTPEPRLAMCANRTGPLMAYQTMQWYVICLPDHAVVRHLLSVVQVPAEGNGDLQTLICVLVARPRRCLTLPNPVT